MYKNKKKYKIRFHCTAPFPELASLLRFTKVKYRGRQHRVESTCTKKPRRLTEFIKAAWSTYTVRGLRIGAGHVGSWVTTYFRTGKMHASVVSRFENSI